jgi:hypothetical protein
LDATTEKLDIAAISRLVNANFVAEKSKEPDIDSPHTLRSAAR